MNIRRSATSLVVFAASLVTTTSLSMPSAHAATPCTPNWLGPGLITQAAWDNPSYWPNKQRPADVCLPPNAQLASVNITLNTLTATNLRVENSRVYANGSLDVGTWTLSGNTNVSALGVLLAEDAKVNVVSGPVTLEAHGTANEVNSWPGNGTVYKGRIVVQNGDLSLRTYGPQVVPPKLDLYGTSTASSQTELSEVVASGNATVRGFLGGTVTVGSLAVSGPGSKLTLPNRTEVTRLNVQGATVQSDELVIAGGGSITATPGSLLAARVLRIACSNSSQTLSVASDLAVSEQIELCGATLGLRGTSDIPMPIGISQRFSDLVNWGNLVLRPAGRATVQRVSVTNLGMLTLQGGRVEVLGEFAGLGGPTPSTTIVTAGSLLVIGDRFRIAGRLELRDVNASAEGARISAENGVNIWEPSATLFVTFTAIPPWYGWTAITGLRTGTFNSSNVSITLRFNGIVLGVYAPHIG
jgi:hypothetical protein